MTLLDSVVTSPEEEQKGPSQGLPSAETSHRLLQAPCASCPPLLLSLQMENKKK